jgi:hypothetical protein
MSRDGGEERMKPINRIVYATDLSTTSAAAWEETQAADPVRV